MPGRTKKQTTPKFGVLERELNQDPRERKQLAPKRFACFPRILDAGWLGWWCDERLRTRDLIELQITLL